MVCANAFCGNNKSSPVGVTKRTRLNPGRPFPPSIKPPVVYFISGIIALQARRISPAAIATVPRAAAFEPGTIS
jgi:hypothetical protein